MTDYATWQGRHYQGQYWLRDKSGELLAIMGEIEVSRRLSDDARNYIFTFTWPVLWKREWGDLTDDHNPVIL